MIEVDDQVFCVFNGIEGAFWMMIGIGFFTAFLRKRKDRDLLLTAALLFLGFGASDFVEIGTGAWYRPWWLLTWKASTVLALAIMYTLYRKRRSM